MNLRFKKLRKSLNLNQTEFGEKLGITTTAVSKIEKKTNNLTEQNIKAICREFNVNEEWLRTGNGEMFKQENLFDLNEFLKKQEATKLEIEIVKMIFSFDKNTRGELISKLKKIFQSENISNEFSSHQSTENTDEELSAAEEPEAVPPEYENMSVEELLNQSNIIENLLEKKQKEELLALRNTKNA
jgi:transcriptional regulator with XRE-family HTH domain